MTALTTTPRKRHKNFRDLTGQTFGRLTVEGLASIGAHHSTNYTCRCTCGTVKVINGGNLRSGKQVSCGCYRADKKPTLRHGMSHTSTHKALAHIKERCHNPKSKSYHRYGGVGVTVCERWRNSFDAFLEDMGPKPSPELSIDRIENSKGYEPGNCRWATDIEQANNQSRNIHLTWKGKTQTIAEWCRETGMKYCVLISRKNLGWSDEDALSRPVGLEGTNQYQTVLG